MGEDCGYGYRHVASYDTRGSARAATAAPAAEERAPGCGRRQGDDLPCGVARDATSYLCVPTMAHGESLGLLHLQGGAFEPDQPDRALEPWREACERLAVTVAERIALALANLRLRDTLRSQSILDPLTGLFNRRYMEETLDLELARAARGRRAIGIIMLDIDHSSRSTTPAGTTPAMRCCAS